MVDLKKRSSFSPQHSQKQALPYPSVHLKISVTVELPPFNFFFKKKYPPFHLKKGLETMMLRLYPHRTI